MSLRQLAIPLLFSCACAGAPRAAVRAHEPTAPSVQSEPPPAIPPADARRTASGLAYVVFAAGAGREHPRADDRLRAHYKAWTASDLAVFDDSRARGEPIEFRPRDVIPGWGEVVQLMVVGDRIRVWIPESLAYQGRPGMPAGMLIFDIELLGIAG